MPVAPLNLDTTLPDTDTSRAANTAAIVRWLTAADPRTLEAISRVFGDLGWRSQIIEQKINELISAAELTHDLTGYTLTDGTKPFSGVISGVEGAAGANLTTRAGAAAIAAALIGSLSSTIDDVEVRVTALEALPIVRYSDWVEHTWTAGVKHYLDLPLTESVGSLDRVISIQLTEKLDTSVPTIMVPSPTSIWRYRPVMIGSSRGAAVDDAWMPSVGVVRILLPSTSSYASGYEVGAAYDLPGARQRFYRAAVTEHQ
jgi:hypothetical protein